MTARKNGKRPHNRQTAGKTADNGSAPALIPQPHGGALLAGGKLGNAGGGRLTEKLEEMGVPSAEFIERLRQGEIEYRLNAVCEHCGKTSTGPSELPEILKVMPSPRDRLKAAEIPIRYTKGLERTVRLEGIPGVSMAFDIIRSTIRRKLGSQLSEELLTDIQEALKSV
jgi:hypothetical protein